MSSVIPLVDWLLIAVGAFLMWSPRMRVLRATAGSEEDGEDVRDAFQKFKADHISLLLTGLLLDLVAVGYIHL